MSHVGSVVDHLQDAIAINLTMAAVDVAFIYQVVVVHKSDHQLPLFVIQFRTINRRFVSFALALEEVYSNPECRFSGANR